MNILKLGSTGYNVKLIQSLLIRLGYNTGTIDGIFGPQTKMAVMEFQADNGLIQDGIVGPATWNIMNKYLRGYEIYTIQPGDTLYSLSKKYFTSVDSILTANPTLIPEKLQIGEDIVIPLDIDVVFTDIDYTSDILARDIDGLKKRYPFLETGSIGESVLGNPLYYIKVGEGDNVVTYNASHHALEWITTPLLMKFVEDFSEAYANGKQIEGANPREIWNDSTIYLIPMVNPDGVDLVLKGLSPDNPYYYDLLEWNNTGRPFDEVWKANIRGVDLNLNYPANWEIAKELEEKFGVTGPSPVRYAGPSPLSEPESQAMVDFTERINPKLAIAYHTQGQVIYWKFLDIIPENAEEIGTALAEATGYTLAETLPEDSYAGYKDWFIQQFDRPGYTIEAGKGTNPLPIQQFPIIYKNNKEAMLLAPQLV